MYRYRTLRQSCSYELGNGWRKRRSSASYLASYSFVILNYLALTRRALFFFAGRLRTGFFPPPFFPAAAEAPRRVMSLEPIGEPRPVQASQPGPAENAPLFPETMSWNADAALAA